jgi:hypothetical protein
MEDDVEVTRRRLLDAVHLLDDHQRGTVMWRPSR